MSQRPPRAKTVHLVCNAHLDPVWQWPWNDGLTAALSTFRVAADFCDRYPRFRFAHNESLLYRWAEEYEPRLFARIRRLVHKGKWGITGGAYLQPDINGTSGESHIRQFLYGRRFFESRFGTCPLTAHNYDSFGQPEGFVQILAGCGMKHYVFCRPDLGTWDLPRGIFRWRDRSGAEVLARRSDDHYITHGNIVPKLDRYLAHYKDEPVTLILWGIGNHGGGPSEEEYLALRRYIHEHPECRFVESTLDAYFAERVAHSGRLPVVHGEFQNSAPGCYTSMARVKRAHRATEALVQSVERLAALTWWWDIRPYPAATLETAWKDVLFSEFHDILPGSCAPSGESDSLRMLARAQEELARERVRQVLAVASRDPRVAPDEVGVFVQNPLGANVRTQVELELNLHHLKTKCRNPDVRLVVNGRRIPCQRLQPDAAAGGDRQIRLAAEVNLRPWEVLRIDEHFVNREEPTVHAAREPSSRNLAFASPALRVRINPATGLVDYLAGRGQSASCVTRGSFAPVAFRDVDHSWRTGTPRKDFPKSFLGHGGFTEAPLAFRLATPKEALRIHPTHETKWGKRARGRPVRIVTSGPLRTVVEALFVLGPSVVVRQYVIGTRDGLLEIRDRIFWNHRDMMLKVRVPLAFAPEEVVAETPYGAIARAPARDRPEWPNQRWIAARGKSGSRRCCLAIANTGSFAHHLDRRQLYLNVLRSPAYASFHLAPDDGWVHGRAMPRQDIGEHEVRYRLLPTGAFAEDRVRLMADLLNMPFFPQVYYPQTGRPDPARRDRIADTATVSDDRISIVALKRAENGRELIVRLLNTSAGPVECKLRVQPLAGSMPLRLAPYTLKTLAVRKGRGQLRAREVNLVERD